MPSRLKNYDYILYSIMMNWDPFIGSKKVAMINKPHNRNPPVRTLKAPKLRLFSKLLKKAVDRAMG